MRTFREANKMDFNNKKKVKIWYRGIKTIFEEIQKRYNYSKQEAWDKLKIELLQSVEKDKFIPDDLEWVREILINEKEPNTEEALRVSLRYPDSTPLINSLKKLL